MVVTTWKQVDRELGISIRSDRRFLGGGSTSKNHNQFRTLSLKQAVSQTSQSARSLSVNGSTRAVSMARDFGVTIKKKPRFISHFGLAMAIVGVVVVSGVGATQVRSVASAEKSAEPLSSIAGDSGYGGLVDQTASAYIAANVAKNTDLPVSKDISDKAQDLSSQAAVATNNESYLAKPAVTTGSTSRTSVETYTVVAGDTLDSISQKFNLSVNTIRWANNISGNTNPTPGTQLTILPVNGVLHTVSATDTPDGLALLYKANAQQIISFNDAEVDGLKPGAKIVIPDGVVQEAAVSVAAPVSFNQASGSMSTSFAPSFSGNGYDYGWCTWWAANRRAASGRPIPSNWGNAISWRYNAAASGYRVGSTPVAGAVGSQNGIGGWGHVVYVEEVRGDQVRVSEMNYGAGWGRMSQRWEPASVFTYIY